MNYAAVVSVDSFIAKPFISIFYEEHNFPMFYAELKVSKKLCYSNGRSL